MADIVVRGPLSGREYIYPAAGEEPTADERRELNALVRQQEFEFSKEYESAFGRALPGVEGQGLLDYLGEIPKGFLRGAAGAVETGALGIAAALPERLETPVRDGILGASDWAQGGLQPDIGFQDNKTAEIIAGLSEGLGSFGVLAAAYRLGGRPLALALGASMGAGEARERARARGASLEDRNLATIFGIAPGVTDVIPLRRLERVLGAEFTGTMLNRLRRIAAQAGVEGAQEAAAEIGQNLIERGVYNPERGVFTDTGEAFGYGAGVGGIVQGLLDLAIGRRSPRTPGTPDTVAPAAPPAAPPPPVDGAQLELPLPAPAELAGRPFFPEGAAQGELFRPVAPVAPRGATTPPPTAAPQTPRKTRGTPPPSEDFDVDATVSALRAADGNYVPAMKTLGIKYPELQQRVRHLVSEGRISVDPVSLKMSFAETAATQETPEVGVAPVAPRGATTPPPTPALKPIPFDQYARKEGSAELVPGTNVRGEAPIIDLGGRKIAMVDVNGVQVPFYLSSGLAGKKDVAAGKWYPILGIGPDGWFNKGSQSEINDYYGSPELRAAAENLNATVGDIRNDPSVPQVKRSGAHIDAINAGLSPTEYGREDARALFDKNLSSLLARIQRKTPTRETPDAGVEPAPIVDDVPAADRGGVEGRVAPAVEPALEPADVGQPLDVDGVAVESPVLARGPLDAPADAEPPALTEAPTVAPEAAAVTPPATLPQTREDMVRVMDDLGIGRGTSLRRMVRDGEITTPEDFLFGLERARIQDPEKRQRRDNWLQEASERSRAAAVDPAVDRVVQQFEEIRQRGEANQAIAQWFDQNASDDLKLAHQIAPPGLRETSPMSSQDLRAVLRLIQSTKENSRDPLAAAAVKYFGRTADAGYALHMIAHDAAQARGVKGQRIPEQWKRDSLIGKGRDVDAEPLTDRERANMALLLGQGWKVGQRALQWVEANLSAEAADTVVSLRDGRAGTLKPGYAWINYEAPMPWDMSAGITTWPGDAHPRVGALIRAGHFGDAMRVLSATAPNQHMRQLAEKLLTRLAGTPTRVVSAETMNNIRDTLSPETPTLGVESMAGVYVHPLTPEAIAAMRREGHEDAANLVEEFGGQILFNEETSMSPELVLHEAVHRVADGVLSNPSHVLTRQLDKLRTNLLKFMPVTEYGLLNARELLTEGMTNPVFRRNLSYVNTEGKPYSARQEFKHIMRNFLRNIVGLPSVKPDTALDAVDRALDAVLSVNPSEMGAGSLTGASFSPGGIKQRVIDAVKRARVPTEADIVEARAVMEDVTIDPKWRDMFASFMQPLNMAARAASKYLPSAEAVVDTVRQQRAAQNAGSENVARELRPIVDAIKLNSRNPESLRQMEIVRLVGSAEEVNVVTMTENDYKGYSFNYNVLDADGRIVRTVESQRYKTDTERNAALQAYNAKLPQDAPKRARARRSFDENPKQLDIYRRLKPRFDSLPPELKAAVKRAYELPDKQRKALDAAIKANIEALAPNNKALQNKIFGTFYAKISADKLINPYQNLSRYGNFWLSYTAYDEVTGQTRVNKHSFTSIAQQQTAYRMLEKQNDRYYAAVQQAMGNTMPPAQFKAAVLGVPANPAAGTPAVKPTITIPEAISDRIIQGTPDQPGIIPAFDLHPYRESAKHNMRQRPPLEFVAKLFDAVDGSSELAGLIDPNTGKAANAKEKILEMFFDASPETSFMQVFRKRAGRRGFENDFTLLEQDIAAGDIIANMSAANMRLARNVVDLEYGAKFAGLRKRLDDEYALMKNTPPPGVSPRAWMRQQDAALRYKNALDSWTQVPFQTRAGWARSAVSATYIATLGLNPSTAILTTASLPMVFAPYVGPIYGYRNTVKAVRIASNMLGASGRVRRVERVGLDGNVEIVEEKRPIYDYSFDNRDYTKPENAFLRTAHRVWKTNGMMHSTLTYDELLGETPNIAQRAAGVAGILQHAAEQFTRESSLFASYVLDLQKRMGKQGQPIDAFVADLQAGRLVASDVDATAAAKEAITLTELVNGSAAAAMGARMSQSDLGYVMYLYKRHPLAMLNLLWETANRSFGPNTEDRALARKQVVGMAGMLVGFSGLMGIPLSQQVLMLYDWLWAEDDEPDGETALRTSMGELATYGFLDWLLNTKVSERLGYGGAIYRPAFGRSEELPPLYQVMEGFGGPVFSLLGKYTSGRALELYKDGEYLRAAEAAMPTSIANGFRAYRFATEGIQNRNGNLLVEDVGPYSIAAQALGFMPTTYAQVLAKNSLGTRIDNAIRTKRTDLMRKLVLAENARDFDRIRAVREDILAFNQRHPRAAILESNIERSRKSREQLNARTNHGLAVSPQNQQFIQSILDDFEKPTLL